MPRLVTNVSSAILQDVRDDCGDGNFIWPKGEPASEFPAGLFTIAAEDGTELLAEDGTTLLLTES
jgi:hypothetical protein